MGPRKVYLNSPSDLDTNVYTSFSACIVFWCILLRSVACILFWCSECILGCFEQSKGHGPVGAARKNWLQSIIFIIFNVTRVVTLSVGTRCNGILCINLPHIFNRSSFCCYDMSPMQLKMLELEISKQFMASVCSQ